MFRDKRATPRLGRNTGLSARNRSDSGRNVPAWERSGRARSRLGRDGEKGRRVYLRKRRGPPLPEAASFSQAGTLRRKAADSVLQQQGFSQARTLIQQTRASSLLGRSAGARQGPSLPNRDDGQPWFAHCLSLGERCAYARKIGARDETRRGEGEETEAIAKANLEAKRREKRSPCCRAFCGPAAGTENYLKWWPRGLVEPW